jgi:Mrp family chromosome partitioning ATPase
MLAERFELSSTPGLADWLIGRAEAGEVVQVARVGYGHDAGEGAEREDAIPTAVAGEASLAVMVAGTWSPQPTELLALQRFGQFLAQVAKVYDLVVLDCAPLLLVGDTLQVLPHTDAVLICVRVDQTTREQGLAAKAAVEHLPPRPTGLVVTGVRSGSRGYYYGYYSAVATSRV